MVSHNCRAHFRVIPRDTVAYRRTRFPNVTYGMLVRERRTPNAECFKFREIMRIGTCLKAKAFLDVDRILTECLLVRSMQSDRRCLERLFDSLEMASDIDVFSERSPVERTAVQNVQKFSWVFRGETVGVNAGSSLNADSIPQFACITSENKK